MRFASDTDEGQIQKVIEQLYENEALTDALTDETATMLLNWGEQQLKSLANLSLDSARLEHAAQQLQQMIRSINHLVEQRTELVEIELAQRLISLLEEAMQFTTQGPIIEQVYENDTETQSFQETDNPQKGS